MGALSAIFLYIVYIACLLATLMKTDSGNDLLFFMTVHDVKWEKTNELECFVCLRFINVT